MLLALVMGMLFFFSVNQPLVADPDIGWHLRNAQILIQQHAFVRHDIYTWSLAGHAWINPEWLSEIFFYAADRLFGLRGLEVLTILLLETLLVGVCLLGWLRTRSLRPSIGASVLFILFLSVSISPRTQLFGWICLIIELVVLFQFRAGRHHKNRLWLLPPLFALWINLHGSWPIGLILLAVFIATGLATFRMGSIEAWAWAPHQRNRLLLFGALTLPALFLNPYGWRLVLYPFQIALEHKLTLASVEEWQTLDMHGFRGHAVFVIIAAYLIRRASKARTWSLNDLVALFIALFAGFTYSRFLLLSGIVLCPMIAEELGLLGEDDRSSERPVLNLAIVALVACFVMTRVPNPGILNERQNKGYPEQAVQYLRAHPPAGPMLNDFNWGGYLIWHLPTQRIFIDTRADVFEQTGLLKSYLDIISLNSPIEAFNAGELRYALFPQASPLIAALRRSPNWVIEYQDSTAVLLHRIN